MHVGQRCGHLLHAPYTWLTPAVSTLPVVISWSAPPSRSRHCMSGSMSSATVSVTASSKACRRPLRSSSLANASMMLNDFGPEKVKS